jgi:hypothetical protein
MFCTNCGSDVEQHARFCSKCGQEVTPSAAAAPSMQSQMPVRTSEHDMNMHITILAWLLIGNAILTGIVGLIVLFGGQVFRHLPIPPGDLPMGFRPGISWLISMLALCILTVAGAIAAAGVGLLEYRSWARVLATIMAVLLIFHFPIGTAIAVYAFWVLFSDEGQRYYKSRSESTMSASGT